MTPERLAEIEVEVAREEKDYTARGLAFPWKLIALREFLTYVTEVWSGRRSDHGGVGARVATPMIGPGPRVRQAGPRVSAGVVVERAHYRLVYRQF